MKRYITSSAAMLTAILAVFAFTSIGIANEQPVVGEPGPRI